MALSLDSTISRAAQACTTCRKQKRRCDKILPSCSRCATLQRICDYPLEGGASASPTAEDFAALQTKLVEIEARFNSTANLHSTPVSSTYVGGSESSPEGPAIGGPSWGGVVVNKFPGALFLDADVYKWAGVPIPKPTVDIPMEVLEILYSSEVVEQSVTTYFNTIHRWFPFISRKRMNLGISLSTGGPDLALLFLAMKLVTTTPSPEMASAADSHLYTTSKNFLALLESAGTVSILYLQAMILVSLYEYGHAIYPAAWMTIGSCVRYAAMLGLPSYRESSSTLGQCTTWTEIEERRRVWWATHILDRTVSLGSKKPFAGGPDPPPETEFLPVDDLAWDAGDMARSLQRPVGTAVDEASAFSPFARLAQASVLISKAMAHCRRATSSYNQGSQATNSKNGEGDDGGEENGRGEGRTSDTREVTSVIRDLDALCRAIDADVTASTSTQGSTFSDAYFALIPSRCLVWSTAVMVMDMYSCPDYMRPGADVGGGGGGGADPYRSRDELVMQVEAIDGLKTVSDKICVFAGELSRLLPLPPSVPVNGGDLLGVADDTSESSSSTMAVDADADWVAGSTSSSSISGNPADKVSPLCLDALYCGMATFQWMWNENGDPDVKRGSEDTKVALEKVAARWRLASGYLGLGQRLESIGR